MPIIANVSPSANSSTVRTTSRRCAANGSGSRLRESRAISSMSVALGAPPNLRSLAMGIAEPRGHATCRALALPLNGALSRHLDLRSGGRVVEGARLESEYTSKAYRGFESHPLRHHSSENSGGPKGQGDAVHAIALAGGRRTVVEDVAKVAATAAA